MRQLTFGVFHIEDSYQQSTEPRLVLLGHWDIVRPMDAMPRPVFGGEEDELLARLISLSQEQQRWVAVSWDGFREHAQRDLRLPRPSTLDELRERHAAGDMAQPDLTRFPVRTTLQPGMGGAAALMNAFRRLVEQSMEVVQVHHCGQGRQAISLHPRGLRRILQLQR